MVAEEVGRTKKKGWTEEEGVRGVRERSTVTERAIEISN